MRGLGGTSQTPMGSLRSCSVNFWRGSAEQCVPELAGDIYLASRTFLCSLRCPAPAWNAGKNRFTRLSSSEIGVSLGALSPSTFLPRTGIVVSSTRILDFAPFIAAEDWSNANQLSDLDKNLLRRAGKLYDFGDRVLLKGVSGEDVRQLQQYLQSTGHFSSPDGCTGYFGFQTQAAVEEWQRQNGVISTGIFGRQSREAYTRLLAMEAQKLKSRRFCLRWFSKPRIQRTSASATISQQLEVSSLSRPLVQGFPQRSFAFFPILATVLASAALASKLYRSWLKYSDDKRLQSLQHREKEAESAQLRVLIKKRWEEVLNLDRGDPV